MPRFLGRLAAIAAVALAAACGGGDDPAASSAATRNVAEIAAAEPGFSTLAAAVQAAQLTATLGGPGPFTVFAPTDAAFQALLQELGVTAEQLLADRALLAAVLTYHVVPARVTRADVPVGTPITTVQGDTFTVDNQLVITDQRGRTARIVQTDVIATNGVVHAIDRVILPRP